MSDDPYKQLALDARGRVAELLRERDELLAALKHAIKCARDGYGHARQDRGACSGCDGLQDAEALIRRIEGTP